MMKLFSLLASTVLCCGSAPAADAVAPSLSKTFDRDLSMVEREVVSLAEAMPADKYNFRPTNGEFSKVRTFREQASHIAAVIYVCSAALAGEKNPSEMGAGENGPASLATKEDVVKYLKAAFAYAHKAVAGVNAQNLNEMIPSPFGGAAVPRVSVVTIPVWHTFDHYGQMVVYARMDGIVPPASR